MEQIVHHDIVVPRSVKVISAAIKGQEAEVYIVQNIYGKLMIYLKNQNFELLDTISERLSAEIGAWFQGCDFYEANIFIKSEIDKRKRRTEPISEHIWLFEKFLTNLYWEDRKKTHYNQDRTCKLVSFYSFKGGVGRTTSMLMTAISLARRGKHVMLIDFDLEAPGISGLFPQEYLPKYGLLDFLIECNTLQSAECEFSIDEYIYPVGELCQATGVGGDIHVMPAYGSALKNRPELYRKALMRFDLDVPAYSQKTTPVDLLLSKLNVFVAPDVIFIDTRSGIHQIGGITLARYSDLALLFFYGSQQNVDGMRMVLPHMKKAGVPFLLVNAKVPSNDEVAKIEENIYMEGAYETLCTCDSEYSEGKVPIDDEAAEHFPIKISYNPAAEVLQNTNQLIQAFEEQSSEYYHLGDIILDAISPSIESGHESTTPVELQRSIIQAFSNIMGDLETAAAEDEFSSLAELQNKFYPLQAFSFIFDPKKFLIQGQKGVGKTALFSALRHKEYAVSLAGYLGVDTAQYERMDWLVGTSNETAYSEFAPLLKETERIRAFWYFEIVRVLVESDPSLKEMLPQWALASINTSLNTSMIKTLDANTAFQLSEILKRIDKKYCSDKKYVTIIYDALDRIVSTTSRGRFLSELVDIWYKNMSSLPRIRCKIFLREDIFDREIDVADKVKLRNYSSSIKWEYDQLFAMVWKRVLGQNKEIRDWYFKSAGYSAVEASDWESQTGLGYIPKADAQINKNLLTVIIGAKMGSGNKAATYNWFQNRLADTKGVIVPRSMIDIFSKAASAEEALRQRSTLTTKSIIRPRCFEDTLGEVSDKRVADLKEEFIEYRDFFEKLKNTVQRSPVSEESLTKAIKQSGMENPVDEIHKLINIGVLKKYQRRISDSVRYHFPDIYLHGLGLQRSGMR